MFLKDEVIVLRAIEKDDAALLYDLINDPEIERTVVGWSCPVSSEQQLNWIENNQKDSNSTIRFAIDAGAGIVGVCSISAIDFKNRTANLNIKLPKASRGHGYASRAVKLMIKYSFDELNLNCLTANVISDNAPSLKLWEKNHFTRDGILRSRVYKNGDYKDLAAFSLLKAEYETRNRQ